VVVNEKPLYFRGRRIIDETLSALKANFGLGNAENVMLTGMSMCHLIPPSLPLHLRITTSTDSTHDPDLQAVLLGAWPPIFTLTTCMTN
jgi:hypothetical protein